jgi:hypothetical protein
MIGMAASAALGGSLIFRLVGTFCLLAMTIVPTGRKWWEGSLVPLPVRIVEAAILISLFWGASARVGVPVFCGVMYLEKFLAIRRTNSYAGPGDSSTSPPVSA